MNAFRLAIPGTSVALALAACVATGPRDASLEASIIALEKASWAAWKDRDGRFFQRFLSEDHAEVGAQGVSGKADVVGFVGSPACVVESYSIGQFKFRRIAEDVVLITYRAEQKTTCGGAPVPSPAWATSMYVNRGGRWLNVLYQQSPIK